MGCTLAVDSLQNTPSGDFWVVALKGGEDRRERGGDRVRKRTL